MSILNKTKSFEILDELYQIAYNSSDSSLLITRCLWGESLLYRRQKIIDTLLTKRIISHLARENTSLQEQAFLESALVDHLLTTGEYSEAFSLSLQALEKFKQLDNKRLIALTLTNLGKICNFIKLPNLALYYYEEALKNIGPEYSEYLPTKSAIITTRISIKMDESIVDSLLYLIDIVEKEKREGFLIQLYLNTGAVLLRLDPDRALPYFTKIQTIDFDFPELTATLYANVGHYYHLKENWTEALIWYKKAQEIMEENNYLHNLSVLYNGISFVFEQQNMTDSALFYTKKHKDLAQTLHSNTTAIETHQRYITVISESLQKDLTIAEQTIALKNRQYTITIIVSTSVVLLTLLFLLLVNQQKRRKVSENQKLTAKLEHEKQVQQYEKQQQKLEKEKQKILLDAKTREITSYSLLVSNKNNLLKQIAQTFNNEKKTDRVAAKIDEIIQNNLSIYKEWGNFKMHFDKVHPHFFEKLKQICNDLTEENMKMCAYFKIGMTTKQIAQLLRVIPRSIITNRYRLKKKLQLSDKEDLDDFIRNL
jgi:tetratricopeptide (TPR) repeat protein